MTDTGPKHPQPGRTGSADKTDKTERTASADKADAAKPAPKPDSEGAAAGKGPQAPGRKLDVPSDTARQGLPEAGAGASMRSFAADVKTGQTDMPFRDVEKGHEPLKKPDEK